MTSPDGWLVLRFGLHFFVTLFTRKVKVKSLSRFWLCDPVDCSPPGSSVHGILQARILEWVAISFSRGSSPPRDRAQVSRIAGRHLNLWARKVHINNAGRDIKQEKFLFNCYFSSKENRLESSKATWQHFFLLLSFCSVAQTEVNRILSD